MASSDSDNGLSSERSSDPCIEEVKDDDYTDQEGDNDPMCDAVMSMCNEKADHDVMQNSSANQDSSTSAGNSS